MGIQINVKFPKKLLTVVLLGIVIALPTLSLYPSKVSAASSISATWKTANTISSGGLTTVSGENIIYTSIGTGTLPGGKTKYKLFSDNLSPCKSFIYFNTSTDLNKAKTANYYQQVAIPGVSGCPKTNKGAVNLSNTKTNPDTKVGDCTTDCGSKVSNPNGGGDTTPVDTNSTDLDPCNANGDPLTWFVCPVIGMLHEATNQMQNIINHLMQVDVTGVFDTSTDSGKAYYTAWNSFRIFGIALLVIAGLSMVISEALGLEVFDAYTIKKVVPRMVMAVIGISLSWWLLKFLAQATNDIGIGIRSLIYYPFRGMASGSQDFGSSVIELLFGTGAFLFLGLGGVFSLIVTAGLAALVAFLVLIVRQIVIVFLILMAPLAIACYVMPGTQKAYSVWWESLSKALLMFPIISAFIATGQAFSVVAANNTTSDFGISKVIAVIAYFLPYFALPFTFRLAGGAIATLGGLANDRSRGAFDRLKNYRGNKVAQNTQGMRNFSRFSENSKLGRGINTALGVAGSPTSLMRGRAGVNARRSSLQAIHGQGTMKDNAVYQANQFDDNFLMALANKDLAEQKLAAARVKKANARPDSKEAVDAQQEIFAREKGLNSAAQIPFNQRNTRAVKMAALDSLTKTGYQFATGERGYQELDETVRSITGGDEQARTQMMDSSQYNLRAAGGRFDLGGINHGAGYNYKIGVGKASGYTAGQGKIETYTAGAQEYLGASVMQVDGVDDNGKPILGKTKDADAIRQSIVGGIQGGSIKAEDAIEWHSKLSDAEHGATGANKDEIIKQREAIEGAMTSLNKSETPGTEAELDRITKFVDGIQKNNSRFRQAVDPNIINNSGSGTTSPE